MFKNENNLISTIWNMGLNHWINKESFDQCLSMALHCLQEKVQALGITYRQTEAKSLSPLQHLICGFPFATHKYHTQCNNGQCLQVILYFCGFTDALPIVDSNEYSSLSFKTVSTQLFLSEDFSNLLIKKLALSHHYV